MRNQNVALADLPRRLRECDLIAKVIQLRNRDQVPCQAWHVTNILNDKMHAIGKNHGYVTNNANNVACK